MFGTPSPSDTLLRHRREAILAYVEQSSADQRAKDYQTMVWLLVEHAPPMSREEFRNALHLYNDKGVSAVQAFVEGLRSRSSETEETTVPKPQAQKAVVRTVTHGMKKLSKDDLLAYGIDEDIQKFLAVKLHMDYTNTNNGGSQAA